MTHTLVPATEADGRTAALLAAADGCEVIGNAHIVHAIARQYQSEARVLVPSELGAYAAFLQEVK